MTKIHRFFRTLHHLQELQVEGGPGTGPKGDYFETEAPTDTAEVKYVDYGAVRGVAVVQWRDEIEIE